MDRLKTQFELERLVRPGIRELRAYTSARHSGQQGLLLDANESPFENRRHGVVLNRYPDPNQLQLRQALASYLGVSQQQVLAGTGSDEVIDWIFKVFCEPGRDLVAALAPSYGMYQVMADVFGVGLVPIPLHEENNFEFHAADFFRRQRPEIKVLFLCSPNNPTGNALGRDAILEVCRGWPGIVVVDEAYVEFADRPSLVADLAQNPNLAVMRTFSKALGHAAIRLGYVAASPAMIEYFASVKAPYNLNALTCRLGVEVLKGIESNRQPLWQLIRTERYRVGRELADLPGVEKVFPSQANFLLFRCKRAEEVCALLKDRGILIRDRTSKLPGCLRVSIGTQEQNDRFLQEIGTILRNSP